MQEAIIRQFYNNLVHRHLGIARTIELIQRYYKFSNIKDKVTTFIKKYADY